MAHKHDPVRAASLVFLVCLGWASAAGADSTIHGYATATTIPIPANSCIEVDQGPGTDTKACPVSVAGWAALFGFGPFAAMPFPSASFALGSNGSAFTPLTASGNTSAIVTQGAGAKTAGNPLVYDVSGNAIAGTFPSGGGGTFGNPTATIGTAAVNGSAVTYMRSDAAPAIPQCSAATFGACKPDGTTIIASAGVISAVGGGTGNIIAISGGVFGGTSTAYTATATGFSLTAGWGVSGTFTTQSGASPSLSVNGGAAKPLVFNTNGTALPVAAGGIPNPLTTIAVYDGTNYVLQSPPVTPAPLTAGGLVTAGDWGVCRSYVISTAAQTITIPAVSTLGQGGCINIQTIGVKASLTPNGSDSINGGVAGVSVTIPANTQSVQVTTTAANTINAPLGTLQYETLTVGPGTNVSTSPVPFGWFASGRTVYNINCMVSIVAGGTATFDVWAAADSVTAANVTSTGTKLNTTACNANTLTGSPGSFQDLSVASSQVSAGYHLWLVSSSWPSGTTSTALVMVVVGFR